MANREIIKDDLSILITEVCKGIDDFDKMFKNIKSELTDIDKIKRELNNIVGQLDNAKKVINKIKELNEDFEEYLLRQKLEMEKRNITIIKEGKEQLLELINQNLPDAMEIRKVIDNDNKLIIILKSDLNLKLDNKKNKIKNIIFYNKEEITIGDLLLIEEKEKLIINIKMQRDNNGQDFIIDNVLTVYPIVNYIITRYNYKEDAKY